MATFSAVLSQNQQPHSLSAVSTPPNPTSAYVDGVLDGRTVASIFKNAASWDKWAVFTHNGTVIAANFPLKRSELEQCVKAYADREEAIAAGITLENVQFEVHRWHPPFVYGRCGVPPNTSGFALLRGASRSGSVIYALVTYPFPIVSSRAVPILRSIFTSYIGSVPRSEIAPVCYESDAHEYASKGM